MLILAGLWYILFPLFPKNISPISQKYFPCSFFLIQYTFKTCGISYHHSERFLIKYWLVFSEMFHSIRQENTVFRMLSQAQFLNSPQQGKTPSAWMTTRIDRKTMSTKCSALVVWGENPVTVWVPLFIFIECPWAVSNVVESANTVGIVFSPVFTVNINRRKVILTLDQRLQWTQIIWVCPDTVWLILPPGSFL